MNHSKYYITVLFVLIVTSIVKAQSPIPRSSIGISFIQFQTDNDSYGFKFTPILNFGVSYEHRIGPLFTLNGEGMIKTGNDRVGCIDCPGASGEMTEWNLKFGVSRYFILSDKISLFSQLQAFREKTDVPDGVSNWSVIGDWERPWFRKIDYLGLELSIGIEYNFFNAFHFYLSPSLQYGIYKEINSVSERPRLRILNFAILENVGIKYKF